MNFIEATKSSLKNYARFSGRAPRSEYWYFYLLYFAVVGAGTLVDRLVFPELFAFKKLGMGYTHVLCSLALIIPSFSVSIRRLHDSGKSGWWWFIFLTVIGIIPLMYWSWRKGDPGPNRYGEPVTGRQYTHRNWANIGLICAAVFLAVCPFVVAPPVTLATAASIGHKGLVIQLLDKGADANEEGLFGMTPLMSAIAGGHADVVEVLLDKGAEFKKKSVHGMTPLVFATATNNAKIVALLLKKGASVEDPETGGHPSLDLAVQKGYADIADMLQKAADK